VDEQEHSASGFREALTSRRAGWAAAAAMTGAVAGLSVAMATSPSPTVVVRPEGPAGLGGTAPGAVRAPVPGGAVRALSPVRLRVQVPAGLRVQVPAGLPLQTPARLRLQTRVPLPAGTVVPLPRIQVAPGTRAPVAVLAPRSIRVRVRPGQVRVRLRMPATAPIRFLPGGQPGALRAVPPGPRPLQVLPAGTVTPARLRIAFQKGQPVPARLVLPAGLHGQARLRLQIPARARLTPALPAPPNW
jgi:hypothetical protein